MSAVKSVVLVVVGAALAGGGYWYGTSRTPAPAASGAGGAAKAAPGGAGGAAKAAGPASVETVKVATAQLPQIIAAVGSLRSDESVTLRPEVAGRIVAIRFDEGHRVTKGQTLVQLDAAVNHAEVQQARTNLDLAKTKYDRAVDLSSKNFISGQARDESKSAYELAQASLSLVEARFAKTEIKAPFSGIIGLRVVSVGDYVREGAELVNLEAIDPMKIDFRVPENFLRDVKVGQTLQVNLDALPGKTYEGRVIALNPLLDASGRSIVVRAQIRNSDSLLRPGMFARINLVTQTRRDAMIVPEEALVPQGTDNYIFRIADGKAARVKVETGQRRDGKVEIVSGVGKDDTVVTAGQARLRDGTQVTVAGAAGKGAKDGKGDGAAGKSGKGDKGADAPKEAPKDAPKGEAGKAAAKG
jgi:membrane fusion protein (multidrug efflux system)